MSKIKLKFNSGTREWSTADMPFVLEESAAITIKDVWKYGYCKDCGIEMCPAMDSSKDYCFKCDKDES